MIYSAGILKRLEGLLDKKELTENILVRIDLEKLQENK
jgi:hypothetical protein